MTEISPSGCYMKRLPLAREPFSSNKTPKIIAQYSTNEADISGFIRNNRTVPRPREGDPARPATNAHRHARALRAVGQRLASPGQHHAFCRRRVRRTRIFRYTRTTQPGGAEDAAKSQKRIRKSRKLKQLIVLISIHAS